MQRLRGENGKYLVISGGDKLENLSQLFILKMTSRCMAGSWRSNRIVADTPPESDGLVVAIPVLKDLWHAGGISLLGDILAIPIYSLRPEIRCKILFFHLKNPELPQKFAVEIDRGKHRAGAVALTRLNDGHFLVAVWNDCDQPAKFDFYLSRTDNFFDGFDDSPVSTVEAPQVRPAIDKYTQYQAINFVKQSDGKLFLVGLHNTSLGAPCDDILEARGKLVVFLVKLLCPIIRKIRRSFGEDIAHLYYLDRDHAKLNLKRVKTKTFRTHGWQSNMDSAGGVHVGTHNDMRIYAGFHFRRNGRIYFNEYRPNFELLHAQSQPWIDLYEKPMFKGRCLSATGKFDDVRKLHAQGKPFSRVGSVRYFLPHGVNLSLCGPDGEVTCMLKGSSEIAEKNNIKCKLSSLKLTHAEEVHV